MNSSGASMHKGEKAHPHAAEWDPLDPEVQNDPLTAYDRMRRTRPVAYSSRWGWSVFRHHEVRSILSAPETFSNAVTRHLAVPNGMDPPEHTEYRRIVEACFLPERLARFEARCRKKARAWVRRLVLKGRVEFVQEAALPFAAWTQSNYLGCPTWFQNRLLRWTLAHQQAVRSGNRRELNRLGMRFQQLVIEMLESRPSGPVADPEENLTTWLLRQSVWGRPLSYEELTSLVRNFTAGEIGSLSSALGIVIHFLATHPDLQQHLRAHPSRIPCAVEEILRIHGPLHISRRITTRPVVLCGRQIARGERITIVWIAANRDESVFPQPDEFRFDRNPESSLLWGAGIHACPGAPLARLQLRLFLEELLSQTREWALDPQGLVTRATYPASGFSALPLRLR
ncbi:cytochrome P450 [Limisphaera sp. 4302-co]|uniref:cytochrome P450 n=1 Tax=Limisphaera sp. 4302-co TaxID=3400417 RepID=UPI003C2088F5